MPLNIVKGDILEIEADAIVISANPSACVGGELGKKGTSAITPGFKLKSRYVIHTVPSTWYGGYEKEAKYLTRCYWSALEIASEKELNSVAFVLLGTGYNRVPVDDACKIARDAINGWLENHNSKLQVYLVIEAKNKDLIDENESVNKSSLSISRYLCKYIPNNRQFARMISCHESSIGRLKNDDFIVAAGYVIVIIH